MDQDTKALYQHLVNALLCRFRNVYGIDWYDDPDKFLDWLADYAHSNWSNATWRLHRAALKHHWRHQGAYEELCHRLDEMSRDLNLPKRGQKGGATKMKRLSKTDLEKLNEALIQSRSRYATRLMTWLLAGRLTGLRPMEWWHARREGRRLIVQNAKRTYGRACGKERVLHLDELDDSAMAIIDTMLSYAHHNDYATLHENCRSLLWRTTRKLWPNRSRYPTLYSARHQFCADAKSGGMSQIEIAALMGHASATTAGLHYGRKVSGEGGVTVAPDEDNMAKVRIPESKVLVAKHDDATGAKTKD